MSAKTFFIGDTHFGDENILRFENRPFRNVDNMDLTLIDNWNNRISKDDEIYIVGDFGAVGYESAILEKLNGTIYLIKGNHDTKSNDEYRKYGFAEVYDKSILFNDFWIISHEPLYVSENMPYANIFAHVHKSPIYKDFSPHHFCVSAERIGFTPISFTEITSKVKGR